MHGSASVCVLSVPAHSHEPGADVCVCTCVCVCVQRRLGERQPTSTRGWAAS